MENLVNRNTLITGATKGIGLQLSKTLLQRDCRVYGVGRDFSNLEQLEYDDGLTQIACDLGDLEQLEETLPKLPKDIGLLVLNAGFGQFGGLEQFSHAQVKRLVDTNLVSNIYLLKHYLPFMKAQGGGDIVLLGSESGLQGAKAGAVYCATKFALRGLAQSLRADCSNANIRVNLVNPGPVDSDFFESLKFEPQEGQEFVLNSQDIALAIIGALDQPRHVVYEEVNIQPMKRSFRKK